VANVGCWSPLWPGNAAELHATYEKARASMEKLMRQAAQYFDLMGVLGIAAPRGSPACRQGTAKDTKK
jgi:hypothetical protein